MSSPLLSCRPPAGSAVLAGVLLGPGSTRW